MAQEGEVKVIVTTSESTEEITGGVPQVQGMQENSSGVVMQPSRKAEIRSMALFTIAMQIGSQSLNYMLSNVGKYRGNTYRQVTLDNKIQGVSLATMFAASPTAGIMASITNIMQTVLEESFKRKQEQVDLSVRRAKNGYSDLSSIVSSRRH